MKFLSDQFKTEEKNLIKAKEINEKGKEKPNFSIGELQKTQKEIDLNKKEKLNKEKNKSRGMSR